jgi:hypothetical protein
MPKAHFRFYEELNDHLSPGRRIDKNGRIAFGELLWRRGR